MAFLGTLESSHQADFENDQCTVGEIRGGDLGTPKIVFFRGKNYLKGAKNQ